MAEGAYTPTTYIQHTMRKAEEARSTGGGALRCAMLLRSLHQPQRDIRKFNQPRQLTKLAHSVTRTDAQPPNHSLGKNVTTNSRYVGRPMEAHISTC